LFETHVSLLECIGIALKKDISRYSGNAISTTTGRDSGKGKKCGNEDEVNNLEINK